MKYLLFIPLVMLFLYSCESSSTQEETSSTQTETADTNSETVETESQKPAYADINVVQFKKRMDHPMVVIIDVRTPEETAEGKIEGAMEIDVNDASFDEKIQALDKDKIYLVYCQSGGRSVTTCNKMAELGFKNLNNLVGGYTAWSEAPQ